MNLLCVMYLLNSKTFCLTENSFVLKTGSDFNSRKPETCSSQIWMLSSHSFRVYHQEVVNTFLEITVACTVILFWQYQSKVGTSFNTGVFFFFLIKTEIAGCFQVRSDKIGHHSSHYVSVMRHPFSPGSQANCSD